jgi:hypothetical protein
VSDLEEIAVGAERSRRAAWAQVYALREELAKYKDPNKGWTHVYFRCRGCNCVVEMEVRPMEELPHEGTLENDPGMHYSGCGCENSK